MTSGRASGLAGLPVTLEMRQQLNTQHKVQRTVAAVIIWDAVLVRRCFLQYAGKTNNTVCNIQYR